MMCRSGTTCPMDRQPGHDRSGEHRALSVTQLLRRMKNLLEVQVGEVWVEGEVSNLRRQPSGHWYFSLKDDSAQISCVMFGARKREGSSVIEDGAKLRVFAEASVYEARGQLQVIVKRAEAAGAGDLQARFEALKNKLKAEGLFEASRKRPIPRMPRTIGLVTSASGAALQDILQVLGRRAPWVQPVLMPVRVQGKGAEFEIADALRRMGDPEQYGLPRCDVLIVGRGGGSLEDLWNFNEEVVARAIAACPIPVISAVGHEIDFTISDFVADLRAPTPSAAAELAVVDRVELQAAISQLQARLLRRARHLIERQGMRLELVARSIRRDASRLLQEPRMRLDGAAQALAVATRTRLGESEAELKHLATSLRSHHPLRVIERRRETLQAVGGRMGRQVGTGLGEWAHRLDRIRGLLRALGPESAFQRGFSITMDKQGNILRSVGEVPRDGQLVTKWSDGEVRSRVDAD